ncbi:MAG: SIS domain-containing protein, partial [Anaerolineaceae bacterium]
EKAVQSAVAAMKAQQQELEIQQPLMKNAAKEMALRFSGKFPVVIGADVLGPVARRWKGQINELAKHWAQAEELPEADHNLLAGCENPQQLEREMRIIFLSAASEHPRNQLRTRLTCQLMKEKKLDAEIFTAAGAESLSHMWTALHFGDYLAYYMAMVKNTDPTPIDVMTGLKQALSKVP